MPKKVYPRLRIYRQLCITRQNKRVRISETVKSEVLYNMVYLKGKWGHHVHTCKTIRRIVHNIYEGTSNINANITELSYDQVVYIY